MYCFGTMTRFMPLRRFHFLQPVPYVHMCVAILLCSICILRQSIYKSGQDMPNAASAWILAIGKSFASVKTQHLVLRGK